MITQLALVSTQHNSEHHLDDHTGIKSSRTNRGSVSSGQISNAKIAKRGIQATYHITRPVPHNSEFPDVSVKGDRLPRANRKPSKRRGSVKYSASRFMLPVGIYIHEPVDTCRPSVKVKGAKALRRPATRRF